MRWHIDNGVLIVEAGKGQGSAIPEWNSRAPFIKEVRFEEGVELPPDSSQLCKGLDRAKTIELHGCDFSKVESTHAMFRGCSSLEELHVSWWDTSSVTDMGWMFDDCESLERIRVGKKYRMDHGDAFPSPTATQRMWHCVDDGTWYTRHDIVSERSGIACTYTNHEPEASDEPGGA